MAASTRSRRRCCSCRRACSRWCSPSPCSSGRSARSRARWSSGCSRSVAPRMPAPFARYSGDADARRRHPRCRLRRSEPRSRRDLGADARGLLLAGLGRCSCSRCRSRSTRGSSSSSCGPTVASRQRLTRGARDPRGRLRGVRAVPRRASGRSPATGTSGRPGRSSCSCVVFGVHAAVVLGPALRNGTLAERIAALETSRAGAVDQQECGAAAHRARPARRRAGAPRRARHEPRHGRAEARLRSRTARASCSRTRAAVRTRRSRSCATSRAASIRPCSPTAGSRRRSRRSPAGRPCTSASRSIVDRAAGRAGRERRLLRRRRGARERRQARARRARRHRGPAPAATSLVVEVVDDGVGGADPVRLRAQRARAGASRRSTARSRSRARRAARRRCGR